MRKLLLFYVLLASPAALQAWNVTELGYYDPPLLAHYQDVVLGGGGTAYICGSGGFSILNLSNLAAPTRTGHLARPSQEPLPNCAVRGNYALVCAVESGLHVVSISNPASPVRNSTFAIGTYHFEDVQFLTNQTAVCCIGDAGLGVVSIASPVAPAWQNFHTTGLAYARAAALSPDQSRVYVADESGLVIYTRSGNTLSYLSSLPLPVHGVDVAAAADRVYLAHGTAGISIIGVADPAAPVLLGQFTTSGLANKISAGGNFLAVANWEDIEIYDVSAPAAVTLAGYRFTPERAMCAAMTGDTLLVGDWGTARVYRFGAITGPDLEVQPRSVRFPATEIGSARSAELRFINFGLQNVMFSQFALPNPDYALNAPASPLLPGDTAVALLTYTPTEGRSGTSMLRVQSNDPDEPNLTVQLIGNPPPGGVSVGNIAPDFTLPVYTGGNWSLADYRGRIVVAAFFASW